jgi:hypothetical protein
MKKILIASTILSSVFAYSQMADLLIVNNSSYVYWGKIAAGNHSGTNCALTVVSYTPSVIKIDGGRDSQYEDFKGQYYTSNSPVDQWEVNDGVNPPSVLNFDHPDLSYIYPDLTKWAFSEFEMIDSGTGASVFTGQIQSPAYTTCGTAPSVINNPVINAEWSYVNDPVTGDTISLILIN